MLRHAASCCVHNLQLDDSLAQCSHCVVDVTQRAPGIVADNEFQMLCKIHKLLGFEIGGAEDPLENISKPSARGIALGAEFDLPRPQEPVPPEPATLLT